MMINHPADITPAQLDHALSKPTGCCACGLLPGWRNRDYYGFVARHYGIEGKEWVCRNCFRGGWRLTDGQIIKQ